MLDKDVLGSLIDQNFQKEGANGSNRTKFCNAVAAGITMTIIGKPFATIDIGLVPGIGNGLGIGIIGLISDNMVQTSMQTMPRTGTNAERSFKAIMTAVVAHLTAATLTSSHTPVFAGTGTVVVGSIPVTIEEMTGNIDQQLMKVDAKGSNRTIYCKAIATGIVKEILQSGTGAVIITGSPIGIPSAGAGTGIGVIT